MEDQSVKIFKHYSLAGINFHLTRNGLHELPNPFFSCPRTGGSLSVSNTAIPHESFSITVIPKEYLIVP